MPCYKETSFHSLGAATHHSLLLRAMSETSVSVYLSASYVLPRTAWLMNDLSTDLLRIGCPVPITFPVPQARRRLTYKMSYAEIEGARLVSEAVFEPMALWGPIERPDFVIDEALLPY